MRKIKKRSSLNDYSMNTGSNSTTIELGSTFRINSGCHLRMSVKSYDDKMKFEYKKIVSPKCYRVLRQHLKQQSMLAW